MKYFLTSLFLLCILSITYSQDAFNYSVSPNYIRSIQQSQLSTAKTLKDINPGFPASWISTYISTEIITIHNEIPQKAAGFNDTLSIDQMKQLSKVDYGSDIKVNVKYIPDNSLSTNETKEIDFVYTVIPEHEAHFQGGETLLNEYLKKEIIDKITPQKIETIEIIEVGFNISENGDIIDVSFGSHSEDDEINTLIFEAISAMPKWIPAKTNTGISIQQMFQFRIGTEVGC